MSFYIIRSKKKLLKIKFEIKKMLIQYMTKSETLQKNRILYFKTKILGLSLSLKRHLVERLLMAV